jgi:hypothetical protein
MKIIIWKLPTGGVMVNIFLKYTVDRGFDSRSSKTNDYKIRVRCFSAITHHQGVRVKTVNGSGTR